MCLESEILDQYFASLFMMEKHKEQGEPPRVLDRTKLAEIEKKLF